jgi:hypothetical protein
MVWENGGLICFLEQRSSQVVTRAATGAAGGAVGGHLACAQGHQRSGVNTVGRSVGMTGRAGRVRAAVGVLGHGSGKFKVGKPDGEMLMGI